MVSPSAPARANSILPESRHTLRTPDPGFLGSTSFSAVYEEDLMGLTYDDGNGNTSAPSDRLYLPNRDSQIRRGIVCLSLLTDMPQFEASLRIWESTAASEYSLMTPFLGSIRSSVKSNLYDELMLASDHNRDALLFRQSSQIWQNSLTDMEVPERCSINDYAGLLSDGDQLRWVSLGMYFTLVGIAALYAKGHEPRTVFDERRRLAKRMLEAGDICISFCKELGHLSDAEIWLYHENVHLTSVVEGDASYMHWCRLGDLISACIAKGLHMGVESEHVSFWLSELRKRTFADTYIFDKAISSFTGRPPRLLRKYCSMQLPLDIRREHLWMPEAQLEREMNQLDENGWNVAEEIRINIFARTQLICSMIQEDILELALASLPHNNVAMAEDILRRSQSAWASLPNWITNMIHDPRRSAEERGLATAIALNFKYNEFLLYRAIAKRPPHGKSNEELLRLSAEVLTVVMRNVDDTQAAGLYNYCLSWRLAKYALPAAGVLGLELLCQHQCSDHIKAKSLTFKRSTVIQTLSNLVAALGSIMPLDGDYQICHQARVALQRLLDRVLGAPIAAAVGGTAQLNSTVKLTSLPSDVDSWLRQTWSEPDFWASLPTHPLFAMGRV